ncbi:hypothetical protein PVAP13_5NG054032 [Panicum virgatum]|uniref:Uncharacterized protein n=1 Tax=Panicum virgatum TaxID=38727 RepID=A0A8T0RLJ1_PANVG|nr:hypothetical protein PVAP13_5NG054032 [Panicum virgatum]
MLPLLFHVHQVSTLDFDHAAGGRTAPPPPYAAGSASAALPPRLRAHRSRLAALVLTPRRPAAAGPHRRRPEPCRRLLCLAPPLGFAGAGRPAAWGRERGPRRTAAIAPPRETPPAAAAVGLASPLRRELRRAPWRAWPDRPLPCYVSLTSGAHCRRSRRSQSRRSFVTTRPKAQWTLALSSSPQASPGA